MGDGGMRLRRNTRNRPNYTVRKALTDHAIALSSPYDAPCVKGRGNATPFGEVSHRMTHRRRWDASHFTNPPNRRLKRFRGANHGPP